MSFNRVSNRIVFLLCEVPYKSPDDLKYAFSLFEPWRDQILRLNPNNPEHELVTAAENSGTATEPKEAPSQLLSTLNWVFLGMVVIIGIRLLWKRLNK